MIKILLFIVLSLYDHYLEHPLLWVIILIPSCGDTTIRAYQIENKTESIEEKLLKSLIQNRVVSKATTDLPFFLKKINH